MAGMKGLKKQRRIQVLVLAGAAIIAVLATLWFLPDDSFQFFRSPSEVLAAPVAETELFRLGGLVADGSIAPDEGTRFYFAITDGAATVPVHYIGSEGAPDLFNEGQGTVATGHYVAGVFQATELLARHDETYMPREVIEALKEQGVYVAPDGAAAVN